MIIKSLIDNERISNKYYTCHCTGKKAFEILKEILDEKINYISTGTTVEL